MRNVVLSTAAGYSRSRLLLFRSPKNWRGSLFRSIRFRRTEYEYLVERHARHEVLITMRSLAARTCTDSRYAYLSQVLVRRRRGGPEPPLVFGNSLASHSRDWPPRRPCTDDVIVLVDTRSGARLLRKPAFICKHEHGNRHPNSMHAHF